MSLGGKKRTTLDLIYIFTEIILFIYWINVLRDTRANYIVYVLCVGTAFCSVGIQCSRLKNKKAIGKGTAQNLVLAVIFGIFIVLGNYEIIVKLTGVCLWFSAVVLFCSSVIVFNNIFEVAFMIYTNFKSQDVYSISNKEKVLFGIISFTIFTTIDFAYLFEVVYPGILTPDSINQLTQIHSGLYSNHHPFYHTMVIKLFYTLGMRLFNDINAAVATYFVFQIILVALTFSNVVLTVYVISKSKKAVFGVILFYVLMPYHWNYSCTMWKDVIFAMACTNFVVSFYRSRKKIGNALFNYILVFTSAVGICLFRSNGIFVYFITVIGSAIALKNRERILLRVVVMAFIVALTMKYPILNALNVKAPDATEALSVPVQQIARVINNGQYIDESDLVLLNRIVDVNAVKREYTPYISDPVKSLVSQADGTNVILNHKAEYLLLWISLGLKYPGTYIAAWVEQTKGYWNAGYDYWYCTSMICDNELGVRRIVGSEKLVKFTEYIISVFRSNAYLCTFVSIGFCFWLYLALCWFNIFNKRDGWIETIPFIAIIISLCVATPVFNEFRYSYGLYSSIPFVLFSACYSKNLSVKV